MLLRSTIQARRRSKDVIQLLRPYLYIDSIKSPVVTSSGLVTSVLDISGNNHTFSVTTGREAALATPASWLSQRVLDLTSATKKPYLFCNISAIPQPISVLWVGDVSAYSGVSQYPGQFGGHSSNADYFDAYMRSDNKSNVFYQGTGATTVGTKDLSSPTVALYVANGSGASGLSFLGKGAGVFRRNLSLNSGANGIYDCIVIGNPTKGGVNGEQMGYLRAFAVWTRALSTAEIDRIEAYYTALLPSVFA